MSTTPQPPQPPHPPAPPARRSSHIVLIVLLALALIVLVSGAVVWTGARYLFSNLKIKVDDRVPGKKHVAVQTPVGSFGLQKDDSITEAELGLPLYPGARQIRDESSVALNMNLPGAQNLKVVVGKYQSDDGLSKVQEFYRLRLGSEVTNFKERDEEGKTVFEIKHGDQERAVTLKGVDGGTRIELVHVAHNEGEQAN